MLKREGALWKKTKGRGTSSFKGVVQRSNRKGEGKR